MRKKELPIEEIVEKYESGIIKKKLAEEYRVSKKTINDRIHKYYEKIGKEIPKKVIDLPMEEIIEKYESGMTQKKLAKEYGVHDTTISDRIRTYYEEIGKEKPKRKSFQFIELPIEEIVEKYESGITQKKIAEEYGVNQATISDRILKYYEETGKEKPTKTTKLPIGLPIDLPVEEIVEKYESGMTHKKLAEEYGVSKKTINNRITKYYEKIGKEIPKKVKNLPIEEIVEKYESGMTLKKLAEEYDASLTTICDRIHKYYEKTGKEKPKKKSYQSKELPIEEIVEKYESGIIQEKLAEEYGVNHMIISVRLNDYYKKQNKIRPKILRSESILVKYLKKGLSIEQIKTIAQDNGIIIPDNLVNKAVKSIESQENEYELDY